MDNFSAHELAVSQVGKQLCNVTVKWLPPNMTSVCQPLDQGIIHSWKAHYRCGFTSWCLDLWERDVDPVKAMNVLKAIRWAVLTTGRSFRLIEPVTFG